MFGNIPRDLNVSSLATQRSIASKSTNGFFSANIRMVGSLLQYENDPGVWTTVETDTVPATQLGNKYTLPGKCQVTQVTLNLDGSVIAVGLNGVVAGSVLSVYRNSNNFYNPTVIPVPADSTGINNGSVSLSDDGNILAFGSGSDNANKGAVWIYLYSSLTNTWSIQGTKITGPGEIGNGSFGIKVSLSGSGNLLAVGSPYETPGGAAYIFNLSSLTSPVFVARLVGTPLNTGAVFGWDVGFSADGSTLAVGASSDLGNLGSAFIYTKVLGTWTQQAYLTAPLGFTTIFLGYNVSLSADGNILCLSSTVNNVIYYRTGTTWSAGTLPPLPYDLIQTSPYMFAYLSQDGNSLCVSTINNNQNVGASWIFTQGPLGTWIQNGPAFIGTGAVNPITQQGFSNISGNGKTVAVLDNSNQGLLWIFV